MKKIILALTQVIALTSVTSAADLLRYGAICPVVDSSAMLLIEDPGQLTGEVVLRMTEAVNVAASPAWINSRSPAFTWASETKVACGKAYGYLRTGYRDEEYINKCDCFYQRMQQYMY
ncbi:hypothetical protein [Oricola cellulosilytica]|uniref:Uncharacterized protein n=1 Tax=Oricola cellulosilytica TaxID=1429082 RepID=A0A4R0PBY2_9HYPH|nr:hypothetical protein [Oricola cellulosilytica]TCD14043.1 hypothetical protein E0D97_08075 [Oricola cellulosilytica]